MSTCKWLYQKLVYKSIIKHVALDDAYLDLSSSIANSKIADFMSYAWNKARQIAQEIKSNKKAELALTCSVGLGYSMISDKLASKEKKPDEYFEIPTARDFINVIIDIDIRVLYGVGKKTAEKLNSAGVHTVCDIQNNWEKVISLLVNKIGHYVADLSIGIDNRIITSYSKTNVNRTGVYISEVYKQFRISERRSYGIGGFTWSLITVDRVLCKNNNTKINIL